MFKDRKTGFSGDGQATITENDLYDATDNLIQDGSDTEQATAQSELLAAKGWYITLSGGEKVVSSAITVSGTTYFNTNQPAPPDPSSCSSNLGIARNYAVNFDDATASTELNGSSGLTKADRHTTVAGGGYPPSPVPVIVEIDGKKYQAVISGIQVQTPPNTQLEVRKRVFWYKEME
jgi:type IV pilus assembly protein PilY1